MSDIVVGRALSVVSTASLGAGITSTALGLLGSVTVGGATHEAQAGHGSEHVRLGLSGSAGGDGHGGDGGDSSEVHFDGC